MTGSVFTITRDARGALVHVRDRRTGECIGDIEAGLYDVVRLLIAEEVKSEQTAAGGGRPSGGEG